MSTTIIVILVIAVDGIVCRQLRILFQDKRGHRIGEGLDNTRNDEKEGPQEDEQFHQEHTPDLVPIPLEGDVEHVGSQAVVTGGRYRGDFRGIKTAVEDRHFLRCDTKHGNGHENDRYQDGIAAIFVLTCHVGKTSHRPEDGCAQNGASYHFSVHDSKLHILNFPAI